MKPFAVVFPGQGSQFVGMLSNWSDVDIVRQTFIEASVVLNYDLWELAQKGPEEKLNQTEFTQPALLAADIALWRYWQSQQKEIPRALAGHSLGEYSALVAAQALSFQDAVTLVANRGRYMQDAVAPGVGAMAVIVGLDDIKIKEICENAKEKNEVLSAANFNAIGQTALAGHSTAIDRAIVLAQSQGAKMAKRIPVSVPSHCALMAPAVERLAKDLKQTAIHTPQIPVIHNTDLQQHLEADAIRDVLAQQLIHPVRWVETIQAMEKSGIQYFIECGPGRVLTGMNKRITPGIAAHAISDATLFATEIL